MKTYLVVGGTQGIGLSLTQKLAQNGHQVIVLARNPVENLPPTTQFVAADILSDLPDISEPLAGLAYCPGSITLKPFHGLKPTDFERDMAINFHGAVRVIQKYLPLLKKSESASIVLFSTVAVQTGMNFHASISAAKGAIEALTRSLSAEFAPKIRVNAVAPSMTDTPLASRYLRTDKQREASAERHPLKRIAQAHEIANVAQFLISDNSANITGQIIQADGGISSIKNI